jgi:pimeloyl-ACP methyl ester carboxylesterase
VALNNITTPYDGDRGVQLPAETALELLHWAESAYRPDAVNGAIFGETAFRTRFIGVHSPVLGPVVAIHAGADLANFTDQKVLDWIGRLGTHATYAYGCRVFAGIFELQQEIWLSLRQSLESIGQPVHLVGHGFGGAVAMLVALAMQQESIGEVKRVVTFGSPMVAEKGFREQYNQVLGDRTWRYVYGQDPVVDWPPPLSFLHQINSHAGQLVELGNRPQPPLPAPLRDTIAREYAYLVRDLQNRVEGEYSSVVADHAPWRYRSVL